jgi:hypothetical protein
MNHEQGSQQKLGAVATGFILGWLFTLFSALAQMLTEAPSYSGHDDMPDFRTGPFSLRAFLLLVTLVASAVAGGAGGGICGRVALALVRRGVAGKLLKMGLAVFGAAVGLLMSIPRTVTAATVGVLATVVSLGALLGVVLARKALVSG